MAFSIYTKSSIVGLLIPPSLLTVGPRLAKVIQLRLLKLGRQHATAAPLPSAAASATSPNTRPK